MQNSGLDQALLEWRNALGANSVLIEEDQLKSVETATFATTQRIPAWLRPANCEEVRQCVRIAGSHGIPLYPVSGGKNYGLGSRVPVKDGCAILDLGRLNRIVDFNDNLGYLTVEPGVTFQQASDYLIEQGSTHFLPMIGGPPQSSVIGNALERGDAVGPMGERIAFSCGLEVVLADGSCLRTGFERFPGCTASKLARWGLGPSLDGLFSQSNLGIVTRMTFFLMERPRYFQSFLFTLDAPDRFAMLVNRLKDLQAQGVLQSNCLAVWNNYKMLAGEEQFPWEVTGGRTPLPLAELKSLPSPWAKAEWIGVGAVYSPSRSHGIASRRMIKKALGPILSRLLFIDERRARWALRFKGILGAIAKIDVEDVVEVLVTRSIFLGYPTSRSTKSTYWRKRMPIPKEMDPDRDRCGVIWLCPVVPFDGEHLTRAKDIVISSGLDHGFEPHIAFVTPSARAVYMFPSLVYDRDIPGEDEKAMSCHDEILERLQQAGYLPYRLGIQSMNARFAMDETSHQVMTRLKEFLDPRAIIAPGRYELVPLQASDEG